MYDNDDDANDSTFKQQSAPFNFSFVFINYGADNHDTQIFVPKTKVKNNGVNTKVRENRERTSL